MKALCQWIIEAGLVDSSVIEALLKSAPDGTPIETTLIEKKLVDEKTLVSLISDKVGVPPAPDRLHRKSVPAKVLSAVAEDLCWQHRFFPFGIDRADARVKVAMLDPGDTEAQDVLKQTLGHRPTLFVIGPRQLEKAIRKHYLDAWVDDTQVPRKRFFGYDGITEPGITPKTAPARQSAMNPEPALAAPAQASEEDEPTRQFSAKKAPRPNALGRLNTERVTLQSRLASLEGVLSDLIELIALSDDKRLAASAKALRGRLQAQKSGGPNGNRRK